MTALTLLMHISAALLLQLMAGIGIIVWRRRNGAATVTPTPPLPPPHAAWPGWREFRVVRREFEDPGQSQWSFYLVPLDEAALPPFLPGQFLTFAKATQEEQASPIVRC